MNFFYMLSVVASRFINLANVLICSFLLSPAVFGEYSLFITNSLLVHLIFTSWITSSVWRDVSKSSGEDGLRYVSVAMKYAALIWLFDLAVVAVVLVIAGRGGQLAAVTLLQAPLILMIELALVVLNSRGEAGLYSALSLLRGLFGTAIGAGLILLDFGLWGAIAGQILAIPLALGSLRIVRTMFYGFWGAPLGWREVSEKFRFGLVSVCALNLYMLSNALGRNFIAIKLNASAAGYFALAGDLFFAPIALFATSLSLSKIPTMYNANALSKEESDRVIVDFVMGTLALSLPYAVGGALVGARLVTIFLKQDVGAATAQIAAHGAIQGGCFAFLSALTTAALTKGHARLPLRMSMAIILAIVVALVLAMPFNSLIGYASGVTWALIGCSLGCLVWFRRLFGTGLPMWELVKIVVASLIMWIAVQFLLQLGSGYVEVIASILLGGGLFVALSYVFNCRAVRQLARRAPV